jgi:peptide deformylase
MALINPVILEIAGTQCEEEGCLSLPGRTGYVNRPTYMVVSFQDETGAYYEMEADEFLARVLSHELDHLEGVLYIDKIVDMPKKELEA